MSLHSISCLNTAFHPFKHQNNVSFHVSVFHCSLLRVTNPKRVFICAPKGKRITFCASRRVNKLSQNPNLDDSQREPNLDRKPPWLILILHQFGILKEKLSAIRMLVSSVSPKYLVLVVLGMFFLVFKACTRINSTEVPYSELVNGVKLELISTVSFEEGSRRIYFDKISDEEESSSSVRRYHSRKIDRDEKFLLGLLREKGVIYRSAPPSVSKTLVSCIGTIFGLWIGVIPVIWLLERRLHGNKKKRKRTEMRQMVSFDDVQGVDSAKEELMEVVNCLQGSTNYKSLGAKIPTGILLVGPPGTGKTLLARALAGEAGVPFFSISASEFVELYVGQGAARVRDLFKEAKREAPCIVFLDELDAVGTERDSQNAERDQTLNQLLTEMDGFESDSQVIVLAATNRPDSLDPALCRPGRFNRKVVVGEPDLDGRNKILAVHLRRIPLEEELEVICDLVGNLTPGFVGADLANIANEAALLAARRGGSVVTREDIMDAIEREKFGINEKKTNQAKLFSWFPSFSQGNGNREGNGKGFKEYKGRHRLLTY
ncbi:hypothetical protein LUZ60_017638 [Juncus effusus]|nr:hypothetical protein LUZ60_017638 [Juncus effusus]